MKLALAPVSRIIFPSDYGTISVFRYNTLLVFIAFKECDYHLSLTSSSLYDFQGFYFVTF